MWFASMLLCDHYCVIHCYCDIRTVITLCGMYQRLVDCVNATCGWCHCVVCNVCVCNVWILSVFWEGDGNVM